MKKIEWENYQDGDSTPLNAENLNLMQDNIEEAIDLKADKIEISEDATRRAIKYPDGTLICTHRSDIIQEAVDGSQGALFQSKPIAIASYLESFISPPAVTISVTQNIPTSTMFFCAANVHPGTALNPPTQRILGTKSHPSPSGNAGYWISYIAIGKWK